MRRLALLACLALAACGADGEPERPDPAQEEPPIGLSVTGSASIGMASR